MPSPFQVLGLPKDADERAIKRAYAQRLKSARPDVDPAAFQALNQAYQAALEWNRQRTVAEEVEEDAEEEWVEETPAAPEPAPPRPEIPAFELRFEDEEEVSNTVRPPPVLLLPDIAAPSGNPAPPPLELHFDEPPDPLPAEPLVVVFDEPSPPPDTSQAPPPVVVVDEIPRPAAASPKPVVLLQLDELPAPPRVPSLPRREAPFSVQQFYRELLEVAAPGHAEAVNAWLQSQPAMWSLQKKIDAGEFVFAALRREQPPCHRDVFELLKHFFDVDNVQSNHKPLVLKALQRRLHLRWEFAGSSLEECVRRVHAGHDDLWLGEKEALHRFRRLAVPQPFWRNVLVATMPSTAAGIVHVIKTIFGLPPRDVPSMLDEGQLQFWLDAAEREQFTRPRVAIALSQGLATTVILMILGTVLGLNSPHFDASFLVTPALGGLAFTALRIGYMLWQLVSRWQNGAENPAEKARFLRWACVPLLGLGVVGMHWMGWLFPAALLAFFALSLAFPRWRMRAGKGPMNWKELGGRQVIGSVYLLLIVVAVMFSAPSIGAGIAVFLWALDAGRHLKTLRRAKT